MLEGNNHDETIMTNEDPDETIDTLCKLSDSVITRSIYKKAFEDFFNNGAAISSQHNDAHFYLLTQFELLIRTDTAKFRLSPTAKYLCQLKSDPNKDNEFARALGTLLKTNLAKGALFREFLNFVKTAKSNKELKKKFRGESYRTLKIWSRRAHLITMHGDCCAAIPTQVANYTLKKFWKALLHTYKEIQQSDTFGTRRIYIPVGEIRQRVSCELGFEEAKVFDGFLVRVLNSKEYRFKTRLHGAPTQAYDEMEKFEYRGKVYTLFSMIGV